MPPSLLAILKSQTNHTAIILLAILVMVAKAAGVSPVDMSQSVLELVATLGALSGIAKFALPGQVDVPPGAVVVTPPAADSVAHAIEVVAEGKSAPGAPPANKA